MRQRFAQRLQSRCHHATVNSIIRHIENKEVSWSHGRAHHVLGRSNEINHTAAQLGPLVELCDRGELHRREVMRACQLMTGNLQPGRARSGLYLPEPLSRAWSMKSLQMPSWLGPSTTRVSSESPLKMCSVLDEMHALTLHLLLQRMLVLSRGAGRC